MSDRLLIERLCAEAIRFESGKNMKKQFVVSVQMPDGATVDAMRAYIEDAVTAWRGQLPPDDPIIYLVRASVKVKSLRNRRN